MKVIKKFVKGKLNNKEVYEDGINVTEDFIVLNDGV